MAVHSQTATATATARFLVGCHQTATRRVYVCLVQIKYCHEYVSQKEKNNSPLLIGGVVLASIITTQTTKMEQHKEEKRLWKKEKRRTEEEKNKRGKQEHNLEVDQNTNLYRGVH